MRTRHRQRYRSSKERLESFSNRHQLTQLDLQIEALTHEVVLESDRNNRSSEELPLSLSAIIRALDD